MQKKMHSETFQIAEMTYWTECQHAVHVAGMNKSSPSQKDGRVH